MALGGNTGGGVSSGAIKAGEAFFGINGDDSKLRAVLSKNVQRVKVFASTIKNIGLGAAGIGASIFTPLLATFSSSLDRAADAAKLATRLGTTTEVISSLGYAAQASGVEMEDFTKAAEKMQQAALQAAKGGVDQAVALQLLGTNAQDFANMKLEDKFLLVADAIEKIQNPMEKSLILSGLFGDEFGKLLPLFSKGRAGIKGLIAEASFVGSVINSDDAKQAVEINRELNKAWIAMKNVLFEVGLSVIGFNGPIKEGTAYILDTLKIIRDWIRENRQLIATIFLVSAGVVAGGAALAAFGFAITGIISGFSAIIAVGTTIIGAIFTPLTLKIIAITAAAVGLIYAFTTFTESGRQVKSAFLETWNTVKSAFFDAYEGIVAALQKGDLSLAGEIAVTALEVAWQAGMLHLTQQWVKFKDTVVDGFRSIQSLANDMILGFEVMFIAFTEGWDKAIQHGKMVGEQLDKMAEQQKKDADLFRGKQVEDAKARLEEAKNKLKELNKRAMEPKKEKVDAGKVAEEADRVRMRLEMSLGDSVKGTFTSADFKGALGLGKANEAAKKQYEIMKQQLAVLIDINKKVAPGAFQ
jgi:hypothetical protein